MCRAKRRREGYSDLTVEEVMAEPIVRALMQADHVDPAAFEALLCSIAARSPGRGIPGSPETHIAARTRCAIALRQLGDVTTFRGNKSSSAHLSAAGPRCKYAVHRSPHPSRPCRRAMTMGAVRCYDFVSDRCPAQ